MEPSTGLSDEALFTRYLTGDKDAFAELAARYERPLLGLALGILNQNREAARDAVQDAWVRVVRSAHTFRGRSTLRTWLYRITINTCKDTRHKQRELGLPLPAGGGRGEGSDPQEPSEHDDRLSGRTAELTAALHGLSPDHRLLLLLCYHRDLTHPQAAEVLGIPLGTLKSRLHAALNDLRARMHQGALSASPGAPRPLSTSSLSTEPKR